MFEKIRNIFRIPDLRKRVLFTLGILAVYRLGSQIPTPGVNLKLLAQFFDQQAGSALGLVDLFSGGNLRKLTIFALGIMPYITASIIFQLLTVVYEPLAKLQKEGELGRRKITQWTRYVTVVLGAIQSLAIALTLSHGSGGVSYVLNPGPGFIFTTILTLTTGTAFIMWLGEQITDRGIGNGMSLLIFAGIVVGIPRGIQDLIDKAKTQAWGSFTVPALLILVVMMIAIVAFIVFVERSERRIPVQYAKRIVGHLRQLHPIRAPALCRIRIRAEQRFPDPGFRRTAPRRALVRAALHCGHRLLRLLLHLDCFPSRRHCRQHAQVWRVHSRHPSRPAHF
jgi:preprotein translocase subunit SecY